MGIPLNDDQIEPMAQLVSKRSSPSSNSENWNSFVTLSVTRSLSLLCPQRVSGRVMAADAGSELTRPGFCSLFHHLSAVKNIASLSVL